LGRDEGGYHGSATATFALASLLLPVLHWLEVIDLIRSEAAKAPIKVQSCAAM